MRVLLLAPKGSELSIVRGVVGELGYQPVETDDVQIAEDSLEENLNWNSVGAVIGCLTLADSSRNDVVLVGLGFALGLGLPTLVLSEAGYRSIAAWPASVTLGRAGLRNVEELRFQIRLFIAQLESGVVTLQPARSREVTLDSRFWQVRNELNEIRRTEHARGFRFEQWFVNLLRSSGIDVAEPQNARDRGFDMVFTLPRDVPAFGPVVAEITSAGSARQIEDTAVRLQNIVTQERAGLGFVIYDDERLSRGMPTRPLPFVAVVGIGDLLDSAERLDSLPRALVTIRNELVHRL